MTENYEIVNPSSKKNPCEISHQEANIPTMSLIIREGRDLLWIYMEIFMHLFNILTFKFIVSPPLTHSVYSAIFSFYQFFQNQSTYLFPFLGISSPVLCDRIKWPLSHSWHFNYPLHLIPPYFHSCFNYSFD